MSLTRIIGIDPGSRFTGFGIIDADTRTNRYVHCGVLKIPAMSLPEKLGWIFRELSEVIREWQPEEMAIEDVFMARNAQSALKLGQARGAAICAGTSFDLPVAEYAARLVKQSVVGSGAADKTQVQHMMRMLLSLREPLQEDSADALAVAVCHAHMRSSNNRLAAMGAMR